MQFETKLGVLSVETVQAAYKATGIEPDAGVYYDERSQRGCGLAVFVEHHAPGSFTRQWNRASWHVIREALEITPEQEDSFSAGFHGHGLESEESEPEWYALGKACHDAIRPR